MQAPGQVWVWIRSKTDMVLPTLGNLDWSRGWQPFSVQGQVVSSSGLADYIKATISG